MNTSGVNKAVRLDGSINKSDMEVDFKELMTKFTTKEGRIWSRNMKMRSR